MKTLNQCQNNDVRAELIKVYSGSFLPTSSLVGVEVLVGLGLSGRQARVYLALLRAGDATAKVVSAASGVNLQDVHGVLNSLQRIGLVEKKLTHPTTFRASPLDVVLGGLLEQKTAELSKIKEQVKCLKSYALTAGNVAVPMRPCFGVVSEGDKGKKYLNAILNVQSSLETIVTYMQLRQMAMHYETQLEDALRKGVLIRIITEKTQQPLPKCVQNTRGNFSIKFLADPPGAVFAIFDESQVSIALSSSINLTKGPNFWTNNPAIVALSKSCFKTIWTKAHP